jgi:hypothetical protein
MSSENENSSNTIEQITKKGLLERIINSIPIITALLLFFGFLNYFTYYDRLDIDIISYLTTGELLLSFLNLLVPFLYVLPYIILVFISTATSTALTSIF